MLNLHGANVIIMNNVDEANQLFLKKKFNDAIIKYEINTLSSFIANDKIKQPLLPIINGIINNKNNEKDPIKNVIIKSQIFCFQ